MHFFACKVDICLAKTFFWIPWTFTWFPWLSVHNIDLFNQSSMPCYCSIQSMPISKLYDPKGMMFRFSFIGNPFKFTSHSLTISKTFHFTPVATWTIQGLSCFSFPSLHSSTILGETYLQQALGSISIEIEVFKILPSISTMVAWWYSCRPSKAT